MRLQSTKRIIDFLAFHVLPDRSSSSHALTKIAQNAKRPKNQFIGTHSAKRDFTVAEIKKEVVAAASPMPEHWLPMSNLDLLMSAHWLPGVFLCYKKTPQLDNSFTFASMSAVLKRALAQVLVSFYPFSGEIVNNTLGEPELLCNNRGVDFIEAFADVELCDLDLYNPDESIEGKLVPQKKHGVLCVQVTEFKCGGLMVACTFDHRVADGYSFYMFLVSWAETARLIPLSLRPSFRRSLLNPRRPGLYSSSLNHLYIPISTLPPAPEPQHCSADDIISHIYYISTDQLIRLQLLASRGGTRKTKFEAFCAFLWKLVATGVTEEGQFCKLGIVVDGRMRLSQGEIDKSKLFSSYFGNVLSIPYGEKPVRVLTNQPLHLTADSVHAFLESALTKDHFLDLVDLVEARRPEPLLARVYAGGEDGPNGPALVVSSGQLFALSEVEFGWGKPVFGSNHFPWGGKAGYVMPMPSPLGNGDWVVYMHMMKGQVELIEREAGDVFKPLTFEYLNGN
ncbi:hypothetical protein Vadar_029719 [Vaccinium darrowii]|uniref:Uncharacterized protein n=1 Tax=Vaccinium darrowii TaxID=229202 RepID=A0ACB7YRL7_9ERIC|nr:hypothetical protein Vadar_029719 [Vaccinium darrowii]